MADYSNQICHRAAQVEVLLGQFEDVARKSVIRCGYSRRRVSMTSGNHWKSCLVAKDGGGGAWDTLST